MPSLTQNQPNLEKDGPLIEIHFFIPSDLERQYKEQGKTIPAPVIVKAMIDTGASHCVIQEGIPKKLGLNPVGSTKISTPSCNGKYCYRYFLRMAIPAHQLVYEGPFTAVPLQGQNIECLVGRDVLKHGILIYIGYANMITFSLL